jgi:hypothetical protein
MAAELPVSTSEWQRFPQTEATSDTPPIRLDGSKYLAEGVWQSAAYRPLSTTHRTLSNGFDQGLPHSRKPFTIFPTAFGHVFGGSVSEGACVGDSTRGVYRVIFSGGIRIFIHVEDYEPGTPNPGLSWHLRNAHVPESEVFVSGGTAVLWDDDIVIYTGEEHGGVLVCGSRAGLGGRDDFFRDGARRSRAGLGRCAGDGSVHSAT